MVDGRARLQSIQAGWLGKNLMEQRNWTREAFDVIQALLSGPPGTAAFDFDNTLILNDLGEATMNYIALQGLVRADTADFWKQALHPALADEDVGRLRRAQEAALGQGGAAVAFGEEMLRAYEILAHRAGLETAYRWTRVFFAGHSEQDLRGMASHVFAHEQGESIGRARLPGGGEINTGIRIFAEIRDLIEAFSVAGWRVCIVTASPEPLIQAVIGQWGLPEVNVFGMQLERAPGPQGAFLPNVVEPLTFAYGKVARLLAEEPRALRFAAGDSWGDYALLLHAEQALLVDRGNPLLRHHAQRSGFIVQPRFISA